MRKVFHCILLLVLAMTCACSHSPRGMQLPRQRAFPRPALPDTALCDIPDAPLFFPANTHALATWPKDGWLDVAYPSLGAVVHITFTEATAASIDGIKENRMERLMLNSGDRPTDFAEFVNPHGFSVITARTDGSSTPVQFLATDDSAWVVSGAAYFSTPEAATAVDSMRPIVDAIHNDLLRALQMLDYK